MDQAQGALDAARAAGAAEYATSEFRAAEVALERSHQAVADDDYRLALSHALDARERARNAAGQAADQQAQVRSEAERTVTLIEEALRIVSARLDAARPPASGDVLAAARDAMSHAETSVSQARQALEAEDYLTAQSNLEGVLERIQETTDEIDGGSPDSR